MSEMEQLTQMGRGIETGSFAIIDQEVGPHSHTAEQWPIVRRAIHTTGDFEFSELFRFSPDAVTAGIEALKRGAPIMSDVTMIQAGLNAQRLAVYHNPCHCLIRDPEVIRDALASGSTRAIMAMRTARDRGLLDGAIIAIGNAPTALLELLRQIEAGEAAPALVIAIPVGFVKADESKALLAAQTRVPYITSLGRKGGSPLVVSSIHALLALSQPSPQAPLPGAHS